MPIALVFFSSKLFKPCKSFLHIFTCKSSNSSSCNIQISFPIKSLPLRFRYHLRRAREKYLIRRTRRRRRRRVRITEASSSEPLESGSDSKLKLIGLEEPKPDQEIEENIEEFEEKYQSKVVLGLVAGFQNGMKELSKLRSFAESVRDRKPLPSPLTPAFINMAAARHRRLSSVDERSDDEGVDHVDEASRSFENYLAEMIVEEGMVRDLNDGEELLWCWESLNSLVFIDLVSRFYGELCSDLFSADTGVKLAYEEYYDYN